MSSPVELYVDAIGGAARRTLAGGEAHVFAAFERSCYVETAAGIACLGSATIGRGPLNAILTAMPAVPGVDSLLRLRIERAVPWTPQRVALPDPELLAARWAECRPEEGLAALIDSPSQVEPRARRAAEAFVAWMRAGASSPAPAAAASLVGLGPGLTPAGDDFVGGALIALHTLGKRDIASRVASWALALAERGTSRISRAHLACAARGEGHEALHAFLAAQDADAAQAALEALDRVGHSSGWDAAAGALAGLGLP